MRDDRVVRFLLHFTLKRTSFLDGEALFKGSIVLSTEYLAQCLMLPKISNNEIFVTIIIIVL